MEDGNVFALQSTFGTQQSPINLVTADCFKITDELKGDPKSGPYKGRIESDGDHANVVLDCKDPPTLSFRGVTAKLIKIHYHAPSEHFIDNKQMEAEFHFVHEVDPVATTNVVVPPPSTLLVLGVFAKPSKEKEASKDGLYGKLLSLSEGKDDKEALNFEESIIRDAYADLSKFYHYRGSLTSGKYAEIVSWFVLENQIDIAKPLFKKIKLLDQPTRPLQLLNRRLVLHRS